MHAISGLYTLEGLQAAYCLHGIELSCIDCTVSV